MALLFCTAKVPIRMINRFLEEYVKEDSDAYHFLSLVRTRDQETLDEPGTTPPIQDFDTGFEGISDSDLRKYAKERLRKHTETRNTTISGTEIAVLDEKSITQSTVVLHQSYPKDLWDPDPIVGTPDITDDGLLWWKWRVPFNRLWSFWIGVSNRSIAQDTIEVYTRPEYQGSDGVVDTETTLKIIKGEIEDPRAKGGDRE